MRFSEHDYSILLNTFKEFKQNNLDEWVEYKKDVEKSGKFNVLENRLAWDLWNGLHCYDKIDMKIGIDFKYNDSHIQTACLKAARELELI